MSSSDHYLPEHLLREWQQIVDLVTRLAGARVGLIMRVRDEDLEVFVASQVSL